METRNYKVSAKNCAGNASKGAKQFSIGLPTKWVKEMGITVTERNVELSFDGSVISIRKVEEPRADEQSTVISSAAVRRGGKKGKEAEHEK